MVAWHVSWLVSVGAAVFEDESVREEQNELEPPPFVTVTLREQAFGNVVSLSTRQRGEYVPTAAYVQVLVLPVPVTAACPSPHSMV